MLEPPVPVGSGPIGTRMYYGISRGEVRGDRLNGKVLSGGEWALIRPDGFLSVDVRVQFETHDGAFLYVQYFGLLEMNEAVIDATTNGTGTGYEDQYFSPTRASKPATSATHGSTGPSSSVRVT